MKKVIDFPNQSSSKDTQPVLNDKAIIDAMMGNFKEWVKNSYGFNIGYQELREIAIQLFWAEYTYMMSAALREAQEEAQGINSEEDDEPKD